MHSEDGRMPLRIVDPDLILDTDPNLVFVVEVPSDGTSRIFGIWSSRAGAERFLRSPLGRAVLATYGETAEDEPLNSGDYIRPFPLDAVVADPRDLADALDEDVNPITPPPPPPPASTGWGA
jgi:hypothetical protein